MASHHVHHTPDGAASRPHPQELDFVPHPGANCLQRFAGGDAVDSAPRVAQLIAIIFLAAAGFFGVQTFVDRFDCF